MERSVVNFCPPNQEQVTQIRFYRTTIKGVRTHVQLYNFTELFFGHDGGAELARGFFPQKADARRRGKTEGSPSRLLHYYCVRRLSLVEVDYEMEFGHLRFISSTGIGHEISIF